MKRTFDIRRAGAALLIFALLGVGVLGCGGGNNTENTGEPGLTTTGAAEEGVGGIESTAPPVEGNKAEAEELIEQTEEQATALISQAKQQAEESIEEAKSNSSLGKDALKEAKEEANETLLEAKESAKKAVEGAKAKAEEIGG